MKKPRPQAHLQVEESGAGPHGLADLQAVEEAGKAWGALVVGWEHLNVHGGDGAPGRGDKDGCEINSGGKTQMNAGSIRWYTFLQSRSTFINFNCPPRASILKDRDCGRVLFTVRQLVCGM